MDTDRQSLDSDDTTHVTRPVVEYDTPPIDPRSTPKLAPLIWCSMPALVGAALLLETVRRIQAKPGDVMAGADTFVLLVPVVLISGITSGAALLAIFESRKTIANVTLMSLNLMWFAVCIGFFILRRVS